MWRRFESRVFFVKQKTAYEVRISDWSSDVCSSDLGAVGKLRLGRRRPQAFRGIAAGGREFLAGEGVEQPVAESDREVEVRKVGVAGEPHEAEAVAARHALAGAHGHAAF